MLPCSRCCVKVCPPVDVCVSPHINLAEPNLSPNHNLSSSEKVNLTLTVPLPLTSYLCYAQP